ncbi:WD40-repeat-containing domain protein [Haematococcus lacustris]
MRQPSTTAAQAPAAASSSSSSNGDRVMDQSRQEVGPGQAEGSHLAAGATSGFMGRHQAVQVSGCAITALAFAHTCNDLLVLADSQGGVWKVQLQPAGMPDVIKAQRVHQGAVTDLTWSADNSRLLSSSEEGVAIWDATGPTAIRTISMQAIQAGLVCCSTLFCLNANLALLGTGQGCLEVVNCSTGTVQQKVSLLPMFGGVRGLRVTAVASGPHHVAAGDSSGWVHLLRVESSGHSGSSLQRLTSVAKLRMLPPAAPPAAVRGLQHHAYCVASGTPILLGCASGGTVAVLRITAHSRLELHLWVHLPGSGPLCPVATSPLSVLSGLPRLAVGCLAQHQVGVFSLDALDTPTAASPQRLSNTHITTAGGGKGAEPGPGSAGLVGPAAAQVSGLQGHRAAVSRLAWAFDESRLASADTSGCLLLWT